MPELYVGASQGSALPFYLAIKTLGGDLVPQPANSPTLELLYNDECTHAGQRSVNVVMSMIEPGRYFYVWRIPKNEPLVRHHIVFRAVLDDEQDVATDASYMISELIQQPIFYIYVDIIKGLQICYPEVMAQSPKCKKHPHITKWQREEIDIGLDDRAIEGAFRFGEYPNAVVDRRVVGKMQYSLGIGGDIASEVPGGGSAIRPGDPATDTKYTFRTKYRYQ
jgi:hypothetical protein